MAQPVAPVLAHAGHDAVLAPAGHGAVPALVGAAPASLLVTTALLYSAAALRERRSGRGWPARRVTYWWAGSALAAAALTGPLAERADVDFGAHALGHVLLGMLAPLLLVLAAPVTLALRTLPTRQARRLARLLASAPARLLTAPVPATLLNVGGLWLLYRTGLCAAAAGQPVLHAAVHLHMLAAGYLFTVALVGPDPAPHRPSHGHRAVVLVLAMAGHAVLAKSLYAYPPAGVPADQARLGGQVMWYAGDLAYLALLVAFCASWYATTAPRRTRADRGATRPEQPQRSADVTRPRPPDDVRSRAGAAAWGRAASPWPP